MLKTVSSITNAIGALNYKGTWNASTNTPTLVDGTGAKGDYYVVSTAGTQTFNGIQFNFGIGDWIVYNGAVWQRVEGGADGNFTTVTVNAGTVGAPAITTAGDPNTGVFFPAADTIAFAEGGAEAMRIDSSGNVGIGTASPTSVLQVGGGTYSTTMAGTQVQMRTASGTAFIVMGNANAADSAVYMGGAASTTVLGKVTDAGVRTETLRIHSTGGVSIGNTTDRGAASLNVSGLIYPQQATTAAAPAYVKGAIYFDTTLNKLRVGGATAWETITSV